MDEIIKEEEMTVEYLRESGKELIKSDIPSECETGYKNLLNAHAKGDLEAGYIVAQLLLAGLLKVKHGDNEEHALSIMHNLALKGYIQAYSYLNSHCNEKYRANVGEKLSGHSGPLVDFDGKRIVVDRKGLLTPVDAVLEFIDGANRLTLSVNLVFFGDEELANRVEFETAVIKGVMKWQGKYTVFGGQKVEVVINLTTENRLFDNVIIMPSTEEVHDLIFDNPLAKGKNREQLTSLEKDNRSFLSSGLKWSAKSRKVMVIQSRDKRFDDYEEIMHVAKHEFGHAIGLGDLYKSPSDNLNGVPKGTYKELDSYYISDKTYNLVMCDHHGPISNNDIEMVILAFSRNRMQLYQEGIKSGEISKALGRGN